LDESTSSIILNELTCSRTVLLRRVFEVLNDLRSMHAEVSRPDCFVLHGNQIRSQWVIYVLNTYNVISYHVQCTTTGGYTVGVRWAGGLPGT